MCDTSIAILIVLIIIIVYYIVHTRCQALQIMRKLWSEHVYFTREYILMTLANIASVKDFVVTKLMKNQEDIGKQTLIRHGIDPTDLLKEHISIGATIINKTFNEQDASADVTSWYQNGDKLSALFNGINKRFTSEIMKKHLDDTIVECQQVFARQDNMATFDKIHNHVLYMAELLA